MKTRSVLSNFKATSFSRIVSAGLGFVLFWWIARNLTSDEVGGYSLAMGIYFTIQGLPLLGLNIALIRTAATHTQGLKEIINTHWWFSLPVSLLMGLGLAAYALTTTEGTIQSALIITAVIMIPTSWIIVAEATLVGIERMNRTATCSLIESVWRLLGSMLAIALGGGLPSVVFVFYIGRVGTAIYYLKLTEIPRPSILQRPLSKDWLALWKATPLYFGIIFIASMNTKFDILSLSHLVSLSEIGKYSAGSKIYEALIMLPTLGAYVILPALSRLHVSDPSKFSTSLFKILRLVLIIGLPIAMVGAIATSWIIGLLFPPEFKDSTPVLQIFFFTAVLATLDLILSSTMIASNSQAADLRCISGALIVLVAGMFIFVPFLGITGASLAVFVNMLFRTIYRLLWASKMLKSTETWSVLLKSASSIAASYLVVTYTVPLPWPVAAIEGLAIYFVLSILTGLVSTHEIKRAFSLATQALQKAR